MSKIVTITLSPCLDKSSSVLSLLPDKKLRCSIPKLEPGGGGINVARAIKKLGGEAIAIYPSGGCTGKYLENLLEKENINSVVIEASGDTRENIIILDKSSNQQYRFGMPAVELQEHEWQACLAALKEIEDVAFVIASGSLPPGMPKNIYARLAKITKSRGAKLIVDTSGDALKMAAGEEVYLIKPSLAELASLAGMKELLLPEVKNIARQVIGQGKCEVVVVSMGENGAMVVTNTDVEIIRSPPVIRKSTVGAGDCLVAGIVFFLSEGKSLAESVRYGVACGAAATMHSGTKLCGKEDADRLFNMILAEGHASIENTAGQ